MNQNLQKKSEKYLKKILKLMVRLRIHSQDNRKRQAAQKKRKNERKQSALKTEVSFVSDVQMKRINHKYRGKNKTTDVLSFPASEFFQTMGFLGELVIATPQMKRQAKEQKHSLETELQILLTHGVLHLLGFDHEKSKKAYAQMMLLERKILKKLTRQNLSGLIDREP